jgi:hypothetical protein
MENTCIIALREKAWTHKTGLTPSLFLGVHIPGQDRVVMYLCFKGIDCYLFPWFFYWILELFQQCGIFCFSLY